MSEIPLPIRDEDDNFLNSKDKKLAEIAITGLGREAINEALPSLAKNFLGEDCADIVLAAFRAIVEDPKTRENIVLWVKKYGQSTPAKDEAF